MRTPFRTRTTPSTLTHLPSAGIAPVVKTETQSSQPPEVSSVSRKPGPSDRPSGKSGPLDMPWTTTRFPSQALGSDQMSPIGVTRRHPLCRQSAVMTANQSGSFRGQLTLSCSHRERLGTWTPYCSVWAGTGPSQAAWAGRGRTAHDSQHALTSLILPGSEPLAVG
jgi:hypothetical protein